IMAPSRSDVVMTWIKYTGSGYPPGGGPFTESHHEVSHYGDADYDSKNKLTMMNQWYAQQIAAFIDRLKNIPEGSATAFANTVIVWANELGYGNTHSHARIPFMIAGSAGGYFKTGRYVKFPNGTPHNNLLVSVANAVGVTLPNGNIFGDAKFCDGPLPGLTA